MASRPYHHGNLREALIEAALKVLADKGLRNLTLRNVASVAGVAPSAMYRHYASKDALLAGVAENGFARLIAVGERELKLRENDPRGLYLGISKVYVSFAMENPEQLRLMFSSAIEDRSQYPELAETSARSFQQMVASVRTCQAQGLIKSKHDTLTVALALWSMLHGLSILAVERQLNALATPKKTVALAQAFCKLMLEGLGE